MTDAPVRLEEPLKDRVVENRRRLHRHPELSFQERETARWISARLEDLGIEHREGVGGNGVVGRIVGGRPGPTVAFRADFDALPIQEETDAPYVSTSPGVMHACGHDGHTAMLLGLAEVLQNDLDQVHGEVILIFQHAEEQIPGGAASMVEDGCLRGVDAVFGVHLNTVLRTGQIGVCEGPAMAAADRFGVKISGSGGHGGFPHQTVDALVIAARAVLDLQLIVSRYVDPLQPAVVSVGKLEAGSGFNVIAGRASLQGTVRTLSEEVRDLIEEKIDQTLRGLCEGTGASYELDYQRGYPPLVNHAAASETVREAVRGLDRYELVEREPIMGGEDFAYYLREVPGCFFFVGAGNEEKGTTYP
ncbi:MAG: amidohydrolase, partial [Rubrobacter sp.]|nr:amidohydrolase [Rubrobacter sp.]